MEKLISSIMTRNGGRSERPRTATEVAPDIVMDTNECEDDGSEWMLVSVVLPGIGQFEENYE